MERFSLINLVAKRCITMLPAYICAWPGQNTSTLAIRTASVLMLSLMHHPKLRRATGANMLYVRLTKNWQCFATGQFNIKPTAS